MCGFAPPSRRLDAPQVKVAALLQAPRRPTLPPVADVPRFLVEVTRPDNTVDRTVVVGGNTIDHASKGMESAGLGGVVRITRLPSHLGEAA